MLAVELPKSENLLNQVKTKNDFYLDSRGLEVWQICKEIGDFYNVTVLSFDDIKNRKVHCLVEGRDLKSTLDSISWTLGVEWIEKNNLYFVGGNSQQVCVMDSAGIGIDIQNVFPKGQVRMLGDKLVISGTESEVTRIKEAILTITNRQFALLHVYGIEFLYDKDLTLGVEIEKSIEYFLDAKNILKDIDPATHISMSVVASIQAESAFFKSSTLINSDIGLVSGQQVIFNLGEDIDRPVYSSSSYGDRVLQGYDTQHSGLILKFKGFRAKSDWFFECYIENSESKSDTKKTLNSIKNIVKLSDEKKRVLVCCLNVDNVKKEYTKGIPFLADIPFIGYFFRVTRERQLTKKLYFILELRETANMDLPLPKNFNLPLSEASNAVSNVLDKDNK